MSMLTQEQSSSINKFLFLAFAVAKYFSGEIATNPQDFSLLTRDYIAAATDGLIKAATAKGESLSEKYIRTVMRNAIFDVQRKESRCDPRPIDVEAEFLGFYNEFLTSTCQKHSRKVRALAEDVWHDLAPARGESEARHASRVRIDPRLSKVEGCDRLARLLKLLWNRRHEYRPPSYSRGSGRASQWRS